MTIEFKPQAILQITEDKNIQLMLDHSDPDFVYYKYSKGEPHRVNLFYSHKIMDFMFETVDKVPYKLQEFVKVEKE